MKRFGQKERMRSRLQRQVRGTIAFVAFGLSLFPMDGPRSVAGVPVLSEHQVKAAFLYNFTRFLEWPAQRFAGDGAPIVIGVFGKNPFGAELQEIARNHKVNGRDVVMKEIATVEEAGTVHVLFFSAAEDGHVVETLAALKGASVLTVGESEKFSAAGGMITFVREADKVRFEINADSAEQAGLKISAQLLKLAKSVHKQA